MQNIINTLKQIEKFNILTKAEGNGRFDIARIQENEIITKLNETNVLPDGYIALSFTQFLRYNKISYSKKLDSCYGDIVITDINNNPICFIDLKTPMQDKYYGGIKYMSLKNMATEYDGGIKRNRYFLCLHSNGSFRFINAYDCYRCFNKLIEICPNDGYKYIIKSQFRKECDRTYIKLSQHGFIYGQDFLSENFYNLYPELNLIR
jgi:hypothetical protein